jgi:hypothetical protein
VVEHTLGKGEVESSILSHSTIYLTEINGYMEKQGVTLAFSLVTVLFSTRTKLGHRPHDDAAEGQIHKKVRFTKQRGGYHHLNIPIPPTIRQLYGGTVAYERSTGSSDSREAERQVRAQRATFDIQIRAAQQKADQARLKSLLDPADTATVQNLGGAQNLPKAVDDLRTQAAFLIAGMGAGETSDDEDLPPDARREIAQKAELAGQQAYLATLTAEIRRLKAAADTLTEVTSPAPAFIDEGASGVRDPRLRSAFTECGVVDGPVRHALAGGPGLAHDARLTTWIRDVNPARSEFCNNAGSQLRIRPKRPERPNAAAKPRQRPAERQTKTGRSSLASAVRSSMRMISR